jgi:hypothetical protein
VGEPRPHLLGLVMLASCGLVWYGCYAKDPGLAPSIATIGISSERGIESSYQALPKWEAVMVGI